ncbi:hypothetical protein V2J09_000932 [Rumex salicifolius]
MQIVSDYIFPSVPIFMPTWYFIPCHHIFFSRICIECVFDWMIQVMEDKLNLTMSLYVCRRFLQQDFDSTLAFCNHERKQRNEEGFIAPDWRNMKGQALAAGTSSRHPSRKQFIEPTASTDSKSPEPSTTISMDDFCGVDPASVSSKSRVAEVMEFPRHPTAASSTLVELTTRLDFFKERRSQLMEQLHNLDLNYGAASTQDFVYRPSSPPWS